MNNLNLETKDIDILQKKYLQQAQEIENDILKDNLDQHLNYMIFGML